MNKKYLTPTATVLTLERDVVLTSDPTGENFISWTEYEGGNE